MASGIVALALEANPKQRLGEDIQHIIVGTSVPGKTMGKDRRLLGLSKNGPLMISTNDNDSLLTSHSRTKKYIILPVSFCKSNKSSSSPFEVRFKGPSGLFPRALSVLRLLRIFSYASMPQRYCQEWL